jgi:hypothetical protein
MPKDEYIVDHLSYSSVMLWHWCPRQWWLKYAKGIVSPGSPALIFGSAMHEAIQTALLAHEPISTHAYNFPTILEKVLEEREISLTKFEIEELQALGDSIMKDPMSEMLLHSIRVSNPDNIERRMSFEVPGVPVPVIGYIDIIDDRGFPYDIKTSRWSWSQERAEEEAQPDFYLTAMELAGIPSKDNKFSYIIVMKSDPPSTYILDTYREGYKERVFKLVQDMWEGYQRKEWTESTVREACSRCYVRKECFLEGSF